MDLEPDMVHRKSLPQFRMVLITRSLTSVWLFRAKTEEQNNKVGNSQESVNWPQGGTTTASPENTSSIKTWSYKQVGFGRVTWSTAQNLGKQHKKKKRTKKHRNKKQKQKRGEDRGNHSAALVWSTIMVVYGSLPHISFSVNQRCAVSFQLDYPGLRKEDGCVCVCVWCLLPPFNLPRSRSLAFRPGPVITWRADLTVQSVPLTVVVVEDSVAVLHMPVSRLFPTLAIAVFIVWLSFLLIAPLVLDDVLMSQKQKPQKTKNETG